MRSAHRNTVITAFLTLGLVACDANIGGGENFAKEPEGPGLVPGDRPDLKPVKIGEIVETLVESPQDLGAATSYTEELFAPGATFIKVHFTLLDLAPGDELLISDGAGAVIERIYQDSGADGVWAVSVPGDTALVTLNTGSGATRGGFVVDRFSKGIEPLPDATGVSNTAEVTPWSICGADDKQRIACIEQSQSTIFQKAQAVGRMLFTTSEGSFVCTGSLVSPQSHFLTNNHCVSNQAEVDTLEVRFNFQNTSCTGTSSAPTTVIKGGTFLKTSSGLDYTLVQLPNDPADTFGFLELDGRDLSVGEEIYIPQHPGGRRKEIALTENGSACTIKAINRSIGGFTSGANAGYTCDTEGGSSGSPVISRASHKIVALHHLGGCNNSGTYIRNILPQIESFLDQAPPPPPPPAPGQGFFSEESQHAPISIPDNNNTGVSSTLTVPSGVVASKIVVDVDITHTYRGDLVVELIAPNGATASISNRAGGSANDLIVTDLDLSSQLPAGQNAAGAWTLRVRDLAGIDTGSLNSWKLTINDPPTSNSFVGSNTNAAALPDNNATGVTRTINVSGVSSVSTVQVALNITHTWRGDLEVTLTNPQGVTRTVIARQSPGDSTDNIVGVVEVSGFSGSGDGAWTLRVRDLARLDLGTLNFWQLGLNAAL